MTRRSVLALAVGLVLAGGIYFVIPQRQELGTIENVQRIAQAQEAYHARHGKYLQVKKNNVLVNGDFAPNELGIALPLNYEVHVYEGPKGDGFVVIWEDATHRYSQGFGPQAADFTKSTEKYIPPIE